MNELSDLLVQKDFAVPRHPWSTEVRVLRFDRFRYHQGSGDMWPLTWGPMTTCTAVLATTATAR